MTTEKQKQHNEKFANWKQFVMAKAKAEYEAMVAAGKPVHPVWVVFPEGFEGTTV